MWVCAELLSHVAHQDPLYEIFKARILKWVVISYSRGSSQLREGTCVFLLHWQVVSLPLNHQRSPSDSPLKSNANYNIKHLSL